MAFNPSSTIFLCNVPIDSTYQNEIYFANRTEQQEYFSSKVVKTFSDYLTVRTTRPDGSLQSSVKVNANIDELRSLPCNYMYYQNANHGTRLFYAFIIKLIYINEGTTEIVFETDVYQTWLFDVTLKPSYVVREHSVSDVAGGNVVPEKFSFQDYSYTTLVNDDTLDEWGYLIGTTENTVDDTSFWEELFGGTTNPVVTGKLNSGIYQGVFFYYYENVRNMNKFLNALVEKNSDCVLFIAVVPKFSVSGTSVGLTDAERTAGEGWVHASAEPAFEDLIINIDPDSFTFDGYKPKNNKLYTSPFFKVIVTNHNGEQGEYCIEDFTDPTRIQFRYYGDVSANPSVTLIPIGYKGINKNYDAGISISGFPQASFNTDTFKLWLAKNQYSLAMGVAGDLASIVGGIVTGVGTGGVAGAIGAGQIVSGAQGILSTVNSVYQASREPNKANGGSAKNNLITAMKMNKFEFYVQKIKKDYARTVDDFFTMYGYQTNCVKTPNVSSRPRWNYVQTVDVNIVGAIPSDDMIRLKQVYNSGVTLWKHTATVGDYSADNSPS